MIIILLLLLLGSKLNYTQQKEIGQVNLIRVTSVSLTVCPGHRNSCEADKQYISPLFSSLYMAKLTSA